MKSPLSHLAIALASTVLLGVAYGFWYAAVANKSREIASLQDQITTTVETVSRIAAARASLAQVASDEKRVQSYFVSEGGVVSLIKTLEAQGASQGVEVGVRSVSSGGTPARPTLQLALTIKGTFDATMRTVGAIEYAPYSLSIASLTVGQDAKDAWHADMNIVVDSLVSPTTKQKP